MAPGWFDPGQFALRMSRTNSSSAGVGGSSHTWKAPRSFSFCSSPYRSTLLFRHRPHGRTEIASPLPTQHWISVLRLPHPVMFQFRDRVGTPPIPLSIHHPLFSLKR